MAGTVFLVLTAPLVAFAVEKDTRPADSAIPIVLALLLIAGLYWLLTTPSAVERFAVLRYLPGAPPGAAFLKKLDRLIHEGMALREAVEDLHEPNGHVYPLVPSTEQRRVVLDYRARAQELVRSERPSLLPTFAEKANAAVDQLKRKREAAEPSSDASDAERLKHFSEGSHVALTMIVDGTLSGLAEVRERVAA